MDDISTHEAKRLRTPVVVSVPRTGQHHTTQTWWARCYSSRLGYMEQWGKTEDEAIQSLKKFVSINGKPCDLWPTA